ncbi:MAG: hypothetical protein ACLPYZ_11305 [Limisphaerales bacterium]
MKKINLKAILIACIAIGNAVAARAEIPKDWFAAGDHPAEYEMTLDHDTTHNGKGSASLKCIVPKASGFGTLMQTFKADTYRGQRIRMSGYVRSRNVKDWAGLWMRVDGAKDEVLAFDNMQNRAVKGTTDWTRYEIVLDVPETSQQIAFGVLLSGMGQVWLDDVKFETVGKEVPTTGSKSSEVPSAPRNLDFEE